jgi:azurin
MKNFKTNTQSTNTRNLLTNNLRGYTMIRSIKMLLITLLIGMFAIPVMANGNTDDEVKVIEIIGQDNMRFSVQKIDATPGETIRIKFIVKSDMPPAAMQHNLAILDKDADVDAFVNASMSARDNEYIAPDMEDQLIVTTKMLSGGESDTIEFTAPDAPGNYEFVCTFPGHFMAGMKGTLTVKEPAS